MFMLISIVDRYCHW